MRDGLTKRKCAYSRHEQTAHTWTSDLTLCCGRSLLARCAHTPRVYEPRCGAAHRTLSLFVQGSRSGLSMSSGIRAALTRRRLARLNKPDSGSARNLLCRVLEFVG